jgi:hypothetical protein
MRSAGGAGEKGAGMAQMKVSGEKRSSRQGVRGVRIPARR